MKKADYKFNRDRKNQIQDDGRQSEGIFMYWKGSTNRPIFIPKRKKKK